MKTPEKTLKELHNNYLREQLDSYAAVDADDRAKSIGRAQRAKLELDGFLEKHPELKGADFLNELP